MRETLNDNYIIKNDRTGTILNRKFRRYLIPSILTAIAISLNEFVDSIIVANLLGPEAMAIVNLGLPIMLIISALNAFIGTGGSAIYAILLGQRQKEKASSVLGLSVIVSVIFGGILIAIGVGFEDFVTNFLCPEKSLHEELSLYIRIVHLSSPLLISVLTLAMFLPAMGKPALATAVNIICNGVNLIFDVVFISGFKMGVEGAAMGTLSGYVAGLIFLLFAVFCGKNRIRISFPRKDDFKMLGRIFHQGGSNAVNKVGLALESKFCNQLALAFGGVTGLLAFSVASQVNSIVSIVNQGVGDAMTSLEAVLKGQEDTKGASYVVKSATKFQFWMMLPLFILFEIFPEAFSWAYDIHTPATMALVDEAVRVISLMILMRGFYLVIRNHLRIQGFERYSTLISLMDSVIVILGCAFIMTDIFGLSGLWWAFPVRSAILLTGVLIINSIISKRSNGRFKGVLPLEQSVRKDIELDITLSKREEDYQSLERSLYEFCVKRKVGENVAKQVGKASNLMCQFIKNNRRKGTEIDVLSRVLSGYVTVEFRSEGRKLNPEIFMEENRESFEKDTQKQLLTIENDYIMGMNCIKITYKWL